VQKFRQKKKKTVLEFDKVAEEGRGERDSLRKWIENSSEERKRDVIPCERRDPDSRKKKKKRMFPVSSAGQCNGRASQWLHKKEGVKREAGG